MNICKKKVSIIYFYTEMKILYKRIGNVFLPFCLSLATKGLQRFQLLPTGKTFYLRKKLYICNYNNCFV